MPTEYMGRVIPELLTDKEAAALCGIGTTTLWSLVKSGKLPAPVKVGQRATRWRRSDLMRWIAALQPATHSEAMGVSKGVSA